MAASLKPVTLLYGQDEFGIAQAVEDAIHTLSDGVEPAMLEMNTARLDGGSASIDQIINATAAMPFLAPRRVVIVSNPFSKIKDKHSQGRFTEAMEGIPPTTALLLLHGDLLVTDKQRRENKVHWFEAWAKKAQPDQVELRFFPILKGAVLVKRIQDLAHLHQGEITRHGAELLGALTDGDTRLAMQEIPKLLAYVNYTRPINEDDVQAITADVAEGDIFAMVDALSARSTQSALAMLERLLETKDYWEIFPMIVRQFRLLILAGEVLQRRGAASDLLPFTKSKFVADKMLQQARRFDLRELERAYQRLLCLDLAIKTSAAASDRVALEMFVAEWD